MPQQQALVGLLDTILIISTCATITVCGYLVSRPSKNLVKRGKRLVLYLCISDLIGSLFWALSNLTEVGCPYFGFFNLFGYNSSAMWTCAIGLFLYCTIKGTSVPSEYLFHIACWTPPLITVIAVAVNGKIYRGSPVGCWIQNDYDVLVYASMIHFLWNTLFLCLNIRELQKLKIPSRPPSPFPVSSSSTNTLPISSSSALPSTSNSTASKGQRGMIMMHTCYLLYSIGPVVEIVTGYHSTAIIYTAMCLSASKGVLNVIAVNEGRLRRYRSTRMSIKSAIAERASTPCTAKLFPSDEGLGVV